MAQLSDDCFAFGGPLIGLDAALTLLLERTAPVTGVETAPLAAARGRVLAEDIVAPRDVPPHDNSAVDGYEVYFDDLAPGAETALPVKGRAAAGHPLAGAQARATAVRIFTGAPMPPGADGSQAGGPDTVLMQEDCVETDGVVVVPPGLKRGANRRKRGEDIKAGAIILRAGRRLKPQDIGLAASIGLTRVPVRQPLRVALFSTGDEIREPGTPAPAGAVYDANRFALLAALQGLGCSVTDLGILPDRFATIRDALAGAAAAHDLILTSGGMSTGDEDHIKPAVEALGALHFWRLAIKPGRPIAFGLTPYGTMQRFRVNVHEHLARTDLAVAPGWHAVRLRNDAEALQRVRTLLARHGDLPRQHRDDATLRELFVLLCTADSLFVTLE